MIPALPRIDELLRSLPVDPAAGTSSLRSPAKAKLTLAAETSARLREFAGNLAVPVEKLLLAGYAALLYRLSGQESVTISLAAGTLSATNQASNQDGVENVSFDFANQISFREVVFSASAVLGAVPGAVFGAVPGEGDAGAGFSFGNARQPFNPRQPFNDAELSLSVIEGAVQPSPSPSPSPFTLTLTSSTGAWPNATLESWLLYLGNLLNDAAADESTPVQQLALLDTDAVDRLYARLNDTATSYPREKSVHRLFVEQAAIFPHRIAVISGDEQLTYRELDRQSSILAARLTALGAAPDRPIAICLERSTALSVALLGVLKSGSCYVPLDPQHPRQRLAGILEECQPVAVITEARVAHLVEGFAGTFPIVRIDDPQVLGAPGALDADKKDAGKKDAAGKDVTWKDAAGKAVFGTSTGSDIPQSDSLAYIIFTSGTTGKPKGVSITHGSLTNLLIAMSKPPRPDTPRNTPRDAPSLTASDRLLALATISFDMAVVDMFLPLVTGATLVIADRSAAADPFAIARLIEQHDITCMQATPTTWKMLVESGWRGKRDLKVLCGGEALPRDLANDLLDIVGELWNCYGPTETTVWSSFLLLEDRKGIVPVGPPLANTTFYVMDESGSPVPAGVPGELYIGGDGVARNYFARPELTRRRFVPDLNAAKPGATKPGAARLGAARSAAARSGAAGSGAARSAPGARLFRTGDLVRLLENGRLEFFGRMDHQVKLRGFRIELGEIESVLRGHEAVANAVTLLRSDPGQEPRLVAYVVLNRSNQGNQFNQGNQINQDTSREALLELGELREYCARQLPPYMLPAEFVRLERFPLTSSGKVDRNALPAPDHLEARARPVAIGLPPRDELESKLLAIFRDVLGQKAIGATDNFFDYGGYSLLVVRLFARINKALNQTLPISLLFDAPTVRSLAEMVRSGVQPSAIVPIRPGGKGPPFFIIHSYLLYGALPQIVDAASPIFGIRENAGDRALHSVEKRAELYADEILKVSAAGPFHLAGWCAAGSLTVDIARQLQSRGHRIEMLALLDGERPGFNERSTRAAASLSARILSAGKYHLEKISLLPWSGRPAYARELFERQLDASLESFFMRHRDFMASLERRFKRILPDALFNNMWANTAAVQDFRVKPYSGSITLFRAGDVPRLPDSDQTLGWGDVALEGVDVVFVPGDHESMFRPPHLGNFGEKLREAMSGKRGRLPRP